MVGETFELPITVLPENANNKEYSITCDNEEIFRYEDSAITAVKEGSASIHIETWNGIKKDIPIEIDIIPVEDVKIIDSTEYMHSNIIDISDKITLSTEITPTNATYQDITWSSSDASIVSVEKGNFIVKGMGKVILTCNTHENITDSIEIIVIDKDLIVSLTIGIVLVFGCSLILFIIHRKKTKDKNISK